MLTKIKKTSLMSTLALAAVTPALMTNAYAQRGGQQGLVRERIVLHHHSRGFHSLALKRLLRQSGLAPAQYSLQKVIMTAKSKHGGGTASLVVAGSVSSSVRIPGNPQRFQRQAPRTFSRMALATQGRFQEQGAWKLELQGNIKVRDLTLVLRSKRMARRNVILQMGDLHLRGRGQVVGIKREIRNQYPGLDVSSLQIRRVVVKAKSKHGQGTMALRTRMGDSMAQYVDGYADEFRSRAPYTYSELDFNARGASQGKLQLVTNGNIKIKSIKVMLGGSRDTNQPPRRRQRRGGVRR